MHYNECNHRKHNDSCTAGIGYPIDTPGQIRSYPMIGGRLYLHSKSMRGMM
jgi:hypothetical protein